MNSEKAAILVNTLLRRTEEHKINWTSTSSERAFEASFSNRTLRVNERWDPDDSTHYYFLELVNEQGEVVDTIWPYEIRRTLREAKEAIASIYSLARDQALGIDDAADELLEEMGGAVPLPPPEEIPF